MLTQAGAESLAARASVHLALPRLWLRRISARRALAALHPEQIREAGLDLSRLRVEIAKPFWRA
ncbi:translation initiation factor IF-2 [Methylobacterium radiodurans]|uniref:Translation initiation factor IF-2 n=1 Tax=Methylobacterium radiodurans TaxID=2202828 RepID=A0A2U8W000_9HYPH|nr:translation initiation factor IF-2 [Methylobacterium radiodurans]